MWSGSGRETTVPAVAAALDSRREISAAWRTLNESKTALRHIENRLEAVAGTGTGVVLDSLMNTDKISRKASRRERRGVGDVTMSKPRPHSRCSPDKTSRSPLRTSVQELSGSRPGVHTPPHTSHRDVSPAASRRPVLAEPERTLSQLVYERDSRPLHGAGGLDSTRSSAVDATSVHYLNDSPDLETHRPAHQATLGSEASPGAQALEGHTGAPQSPAAMSPGSASVRLEKLRQRQADGKLEKLRERVRRQREQLEEAAEREKLLGYLEQPVGAAQSPHVTMPTATVRKVAPAPPAPIYRGFNTSETKIRTSDGKVWGQEAFHNLSKEVYRDLSQQLTEQVTQKPPEKNRVQRKTSRPVRKVHRSASVPIPDAKPVISTSSWREGQKLVKMMLGSAPRLPRVPRALSAERDRQCGSVPQMEMNCQSGVRNTEGPDLRTIPAATTSSKPAGGSKRRVVAAPEISKRSGDRDGGVVVKRSSQSVPAARGRRTVAEVSSTPAGGDKCKSPSRGLLSADIRGILDDLQLESGIEVLDEARACRRSPARRGQAPPRLSRSASPAKARQESSEQTALRKRPYDTDTVRQYIARQQEDRKKKLVEERRSQKEEAQRRSQRLQDLYRKQREGVARAPAPPPNPVRTRLQETYTKLLLEHTLQQPMPVYQPSGESDKENKRQEPPSPSTSDLSVSELRPPLLSRAELGLGSLYSSWLHAEHQSPAPVPNPVGVAPPAGQLLALQAEGAGSVEEASAIATAALSEPAGRLHGALQIGRVERVEALKAHAASLSSRVESEARRLVSSSAAPGTGLHVSEDILWAKPASPPERERPGLSPPGVAGPSLLNIQRLLRAGRSAFGSGELPGVGDLFSFSTQDRKENVTKPHPAPTGPSHTPGEWAGQLGSSGESISEGPLTDSSVSEAEDAPDSTNIQADNAKLSARKATADYCIALHNSHAHNPLMVFQREAEQLAPYRPPSALQDSRPPWEELTKGSTHSVINIFTKNIHNYRKGVEEDGAGITSPHATLSAGSSVIGTAYEDDFISSHSSSQSAKRTANSLSNGHDGGADERRGNFSPLSCPHSPRSTPCSSPRSSPRSVSKTEKSLERTLVEGQLNASIMSDLQCNGVKKRDSENSSVGGSYRGTDTDCTLGGASAHSVHRLSPSSSSAHSAALHSSSSSPIGTQDCRPSPLPAPGAAPSIVPAPGPAPNTFAPGVLQQRMSAELSYLSAVEESVRQLGDVERVRAVALAQQESVSLAQILKAQHHQHQRDLQLLKVKAEQDALEAQRQLQERTAQMAELARSHLLDGSSITPLCEQQTQPRPHIDSRDVQSQMANPPPDSPTESQTSHRPTISGGEAVCARRSLSPVKEGGAAGSGDGRQHNSSSVEEEAHTAADDSLHTDSIPSLLEERADSASVATEYSVRFEESVTEDELEKSFRSLLPSESHWRDSAERCRSPLPESDEERSRDKSSSQLSTKDGSMAFSGGQDSFSKFTMAMVRQYMQEEEVRAQHQHSLLHLRRRALKEKTKAELAWLEHQKRRLRDKGEDDKMPPLRKRQRGLLLRLQQEQAEIRRLQEVSRAARRERQLLLKQQEEIEMMQHTTLRLKQKLRSAGDTSPRSPVSGEMEDLAPPSVTVTDVETRSPSPVSVSGSETSSIMQKLKKMRSHTDERFLTQREQQLVRRRLQAEELLAWRQRLDAEEVAVQQMEMQALAAWGPHCPPTAAAAAGGVQQEQGALRLQAHPSPVHTGQGAGSEDESSPVLSVSSAHTGAWVSSSGGSVSRPQESESTHIDQGNCTVSSSSNQPVHSSSRISEPHPSAPTSEAASDLSDVEGRVTALKEELRRRKAEVLQLKKEQKQRQKERLKAQEASLLKQLESYNNFIQKTKAELSRADNTPAATPQIKTPSRDKPRTKAPELSRSEADKNRVTPSELEKTQTILTESSAESEEEPSTVTPTPVQGSPEQLSRSPEPHHGPPTHSQSESSARPPATASVSSDRSEVIEELDSLRSECLGDELDASHSAELSQPLLRLDLQLACRADPRASAEPHALTGTPCLDVADSVDRGENKALLLNTDEARVPDYSSHHDLSSRKDMDEQVETPLPSSHGYSEDLESSFGASFTDDQVSEQTSPSAVQPKERPCSSDQTMNEEYSVKSGTACGYSHSSLGVESLPKPSKEITTSDADIHPVLLTALPSAGGEPETLEDGMARYCIGERLLVNNIHPGTLRFKGQTSFASGFWAGVELDDSEGTGNGVCDGVVYFQCPEGHGIFAPPDKISHLPERFESCADNIEDENSSLDDQSQKMLQKHATEDEIQQRTQNKTPDPCFQSETRTSSVGPLEVDTQPTQSEDTYTKSVCDANILNCDIVEDLDQRTLTTPGGRNEDIVLKFEHLSNSQPDVPINEEKNLSNILRQDEEPAVDILDLLVSSEKSRVEGRQSGSGCLREESVTAGVVRDSAPLSSLADGILDTFMCDTVRQFQQIRKVKEEKIRAANQQKAVCEEEALGGRRVSLFRLPSDRTDDLRTLFDKEQEEASSPELCNRSDSPVLGPSGQEELAKRLAQLELSRGLLDVLGDEQDWFDEDFGLSSRKEQQKLQWRRAQPEGQVSASQQARTPARPPQPQQPAMLVPHTAPEVEKLVSAALEEIWRGCGLGQGQQSMAGVPKPQPSESFLCGSNTDDEEVQCLRSYKKAVFDLSWEVVQDMYVEDPEVHPPQWLRSRRGNSVCVHRVNSPADATKVQAFVTSEVLKLCGLKKGQSQKSDWQKMLKFGRKKRDRVDRILVQELHDEEALWVNYDEDELFVKMQLADGIFDALLKDTAEVLIHIQEKRSKRALC